MSGQLSIVKRSDVVPSGHATSKKTRSKPNQRPSNKVDVRKLEGKLIRQAPKAASYLCGLPVASHRITSTLEVDFFAVLAKFISMEWATANGCYPTTGNAVTPGTIAMYLHQAFWWYVWKSGGFPGDDPNLINCDRYVLPGSIGVIFHQLQSCSSREGSNVNVSWNITSTAVKSQTYDEQAKMVNRPNACTKVATGTNSDVTFTGGVTIGWGLSEAVVDAVSTAISSTFPVVRVANLSYTAADFECLVDERHLCYDVSNPAAAVFSFWRTLNTTFGGDHVHSLPYFAELTGSTSMKRLLAILLVVRNIKYGRKKTIASMMLAAGYDPHRFNVRERTLNWSVLMSIMADMALLIKDNTDGFNWAWTAAGAVAAFQSGFQSSLSGLISASNPNAEVPFWPCPIAKSLPIVPTWFRTQGPQAVKCGNKLEVFCWSPQLSSGDGGTSYYSSIITMVYTQEAVPLTASTSPVVGSSPFSASAYVPQFAGREVNYATYNFYPLLSVDQIREYFSGKPFQVTQFKMEPMTCPCLAYGVGFSNKIVPFGDGSSFQPIGYQGLSCSSLVSYRDCCWQDALCLAVDASTYQYSKVYATTVAKARPANVSSVVTPGSGSPIAIAAGQSTDVSSQWLSVANSQVVPKRNLVAKAFHSDFVKELVHQAKDSALNYVGEVTPQLVEKAISKLPAIDDLVAMLAKGAATYGMELLKLLPPTILALA